MGPKCQHAAHCGGQVTVSAATTCSERARDVARPPAPALTPAVLTHRAGQLIVLGPRDHIPLARWHDGSPRGPVPERVPQRVCPIGASSHRVRSPDVQGFHAHDRRGESWRTRDAWRRVPYISERSQMGVCVGSTPCLRHDRPDQGRAGPETTSPRRLCMPARDDDVRPAQRRRKMRSTGSGSALAGNF